jgi:ubiquinone/menaquinone biosynthesis C-methylase UbiE
MNWTQIKAKYKDIWQRFSGRGIYPHELAFLLDNPVRKYIISPKKFVQYLHLNKDSKVLEIGSGPGYFSLEIARNAYSGHLVLLDIQIEMLKRCRKKLNKNKIQNAFLAKGNAEFLPFRSGSFDVIYLVTVLGEVSNPKNCLESICRIIRDDGILSITEMKGDPDILSFDQVNKMAGESGFEFLERFSTRKGITYNFIRKDSSRYVNT